MNEIQELRRANLWHLIQDRYDGKQAAVVELTGINQGELSQLLRDKSFGEKKARKLEEQLDLPAGYFDMTPRDRDAAKAMLDTDNRIFAESGAMILVPVVGEARLGADGFYDFPEGSWRQDGFVQYPTMDNGAYALRCKGDSMAPRINHGEYVVVLPKTPVKIGKEVAVRTRAGQQMIKRLMLRENGFVELHSINRDHKPIILEEHEIETMHRVGGILDEIQYFPD
jgi:phage repressor protein C with HTH and peptisase S24 domain